MAWIKCSPLLKIVRQFMKPEKEWLRKYVTVNQRFFYGEKGFILKNGKFERFEPIGITWNDTYCRRIADEEPSGCFVKRDLSASADFYNQENNCTGKDSTNFVRLIGYLLATFSSNADSNILEYVESQKSSVHMLWI